MTIFNTHLEHDSRKFKSNQIDNIFNDLQTFNSRNKHRNANNKFICLGDWNICNNYSLEQNIKNENERLYNILSGNMKSLGLNNDLCLNFDRTFRKECTKNDNEKNAVYDHIFVSDDINNCIIDKTLVDYKYEVKDEEGNIVDVIYASDHYGCMITIDIEKLFAT